MKNTVNLDSMDKAFFEDVSSKNDKVQKMLTEAKQESFTDLMADGFGAMYKYAPHVLDEIQPERKLNASIIEQLMQLPEYERLRQFTRGDTFNSVASLDVLKEVWDKMPEPVKEKQDDLNKAVEDLENNLQDGEADEETIKGLVEQVKKLSGQMDALVEESVDKIRQNLRKEATKAAENAQDLNNAMTGLGWGKEDATLGTVSAEERLAVAKWLKNNPKVRDIMRMAGKFISIADRKQKEKVSWSKQVIDGVERGNDIPNICPSEFARLGDPELEDYFYSDFLEENLQQYKLHGYEYKGKGPIIVCQDCSGSMSGLKDTWAKALSLALYSIARKQKRPFGIILYNTQVKKKVTIPAGEARIKEMMEVLASGADGGTAWEPPLDAATDYLLGVEHKDGFKDADIIFISDGECSLPAEYIEKLNTLREEEELTIFGIFIDSNSYWATGTMKEFCDPVIELSNDILSNEQKALDLTLSV